MMRNRTLFMGLIVLAGVASVASAVEVISIDINNHGNTNVYTGQAAVAGATQWVPYDGGWGIALGSARSANLVNTSDPVAPSVYAAQVWVGDLGNHGYVSAVPDGVGLMDDGFVKDTANDPYIEFIGVDSFGDAGSAHAYGGTFDVYVYGNSAGNFYLRDLNNTLIASGSVTGTTSGFVQGENYVVFSNVEIAAPNSVRLYYSNELNGVQLVSAKTPHVIVRTPQNPEDNVIDARDYTVARDTNARTDAVNYGFSLYGPQIGTYVHFIDAGEYMEYDFIIDAANTGEYAISADVVTRWGDAEMSLYVNDRPLGMLQGDWTETEFVIPTNALPAKLFAGKNTLKWVASTGEIYFDLVAFNFNYLGEIVLADCDEVYSYGFNLPGDLNRDCRVDLEDLALMAAEWTQDYN